MNNPTQSNPIDLAYQRALTLAMQVGLSEEELFDLIDVHPQSVSLDSLTSRDIQARIAANPEFAELLRQLRHDASLLNVSHSVQLPPADVLIAGVEQRLNQAAINELIQAEQQAPASIPISSITRPGILEFIRDTLSHSPLIRRVALAACAALALGGVFLLGQQVYHAFPSATSPIAARKTSPNSSAAPHQLPLTPELDSSASNPILADKPEPIFEPDVLTPASEITTAADISPEHALELAKAGRLVIRVRTLHADDFRKRVAALADRALPVGTNIRELDPLVQSSSYLALMQPRSTLSTPRLSPDSDPRTLTDTTSASDEPATTTSPRPAADGPKTPLLPGMRVEVAAMYLAQAPEDAQRLEKIKELITSALKAAQIGKTDRILTFISSVEFEELAEPLVGPSRPLDTSDVLWWTQPTQKWAPTVSVPIVIEGIVTDQ